MFNKSNYVAYSRNYISEEDLTDEQRQKLLQLNKILMQIEQNLKIEADKLTTVYNRKVEDSQEWIDDYEIDLEISFYLKETDPAFDDDRDNILVVLYEDLKYQKYREKLKTGVNHNLFNNRKNHSMSAEFHCWFYHCLYDHTGLGWQNMLRIGHICIEINCRLQQTINLDVES